MISSYRCLCYCSLSAIINFRIMSSHINLDRKTPTAVLISNNSDPEKIFIRFTYRHGSREKEFFLNRDKQETIAVALSRLRLNLDRFINPPNKKSKRTKQGNQPIQNDDSKQISSLPEIKLINNGKIVDTNTPHHLAWSDETIFMIGDVRYNVLLNSPTVESLKFANLLFAGYLTYPIISFENATIDDCNFSWYRCKPKPEVDLKKLQSRTIDHFTDIEQLTTNDFIHHVSENDIGYHLMVKITPKNERFVGLMGSCISEHVVDSGPVDCPFMERHKFTSTPTDSQSFRIVTYNLLADYYTSLKSTTNDIFPYCPTEYLDFNYRKLLLLKEIIGYNGDIMCLQEVDRRFFELELSCILSKAHSMNGCFTRKWGRDIKVPEGVATFHRTDRFKLLEIHESTITELVLTEECLGSFHEAMKKNEKLTQRIMDRNSVVQYTLYEAIDSPGKGLLVANTHLYSNSDADHIRLFQGSVIIVFMEKLLKDYAIKHPHLKISPIFAGDFNSDPANGVYKLYTTGNITADYIDWRCDPEEVVEKLDVKHSLQLASAYGTPKFTNFTKNYIGCLDYIFFDNQCLALKSIVPFPPLEQLTQHIALPSSNFPSDHLALIAVIKYQSRHDHS